MISLYTLKTSSADIGKGCSKFLGRDLLPNKRSEFESHLKEINDLRRAMTKISSYDNESSVTTLESYICGLLSLIDAYPHNLHIAFSWKGSNGSTEKTDSLLSELACVMYNLVAILTQDVYSHYDRKCSIEDDFKLSCKKLEKAYAIVTYIINNLSYSFTTIKSLPEMNYENLCGLKNFISGEYQFIKSSIILLHYQSQHKVCVPVLTSSHNYYRKAYEFYAKSAIPVKKDLIEFCDVMSKYCHALALYHEGYMTSAQLMDYSVHGRGKAYRCMTFYFETTNEIMTSTSSLVKDVIIPFIKDDNSEMKEKQREICNTYRMNHSDIPSTIEVFHLKPYNFSIAEDLPYTPTYKLEESIGKGAYAQLLQLREKYMSIAEREYEKFTVGCNAVMKKIDEDLEVTYYPAFESALIANATIPKPMNDVIKEIDAMEEKSPMIRLKQEYEALKVQYRTTLEAAEEISASATFKMNQTQATYPELQKFLQNMANYIGKKKSDLESIQDSEDKGAFKLVDGFMSYLFVSNRQRLISFITKNENPSLSDVLESAYNYLLKCKMEIDLLKRGLQDEQKRVRNIYFAETHLRYELLRGTAEETIEADFPRYLAHAQEESNRVLHVYGESRGYFDNLRGAIQSIEREMPFIATMSNKIKLFKALLDRAKAYYTIVEFYKKSMDKMKYNIEGLQKAINSLKKTCNL